MLTRMRAQGKLDDVFNLCNNFSRKAKYRLDLVLRWQDIFEALNIRDDDHVATDAHASTHKVKQADDEAMHLDCRRGAFQGIEESAAEEYCMVHASAGDDIHPFGVHEARQSEISHGIGCGGTDVDKIEGGQVGLVLLGDTREDGRGASVALANIHLDRGAGSIGAEDIFNPILNLLVLYGSMCRHIWRANVCNSIYKFIICKLDILDAKASDLTHLPAFVVC